MSTAKIRPPSFGKVRRAAGFFVFVVLALSLALPPAARAANWSTTGSLASTREYHTSTLLPNGKVLVAGGWYGAGIYLTAQSSTIRTREPGAPPAPGHSPRLSHGHPAAQWQGHGGRRLCSNGYLNSAELYDPATGTWSCHRRHDHAPALYHTATLLPDGKVLVAGGILTASA